MSNGIDTIAGAGGVVTPAVTASVAATTNASVAPAPAPAAASATATAEAVIVHSPRIIGDPTAGFITQYLSTNGEIMSQIPSAVTVAYLRIGLTADGMPKGAPHPNQVTA